ncbi:Putative nickel-responsive regulator [uncultured archaeon]|nr:Putative nickel-responsive regulator [uncultured archaeon]
MTIVSLSLPENQLMELDAIARKGGYGGRSDALRAAVKLLSKEHSKEKSIKGRVSGALLLLHDEKDEAAFTEARHRYEGLIKTLVHNQLGNDKCLEVFIFEGDAADVQDLIKALRKSGKAEDIKLVVA